MKHIFIINPAAGDRNCTAEVMEKAKALGERHGLAVECILTKRPGHGMETARAIAETGEEVRLYACGGDGTINEVANGIAGFSNAAMTCVPVGTGNDFLRNFQPEIVEKFKDVEALWDGPSFPLDMIQCNGRYCLTIACNGIDARIADSVHKYVGMGVRGRNSYLASVAVNFLFKPIGRRWTVYLDDEKLEGEFALVSMCNGRFYGGGSMPIPEARMDDGVVNTVIIRNVPKTTFARLFGTYSAGEYKKLPQDLIRVSTAKHVRIISRDQEIVTCLDGESIRSREVDMTLADKRLNFFGPVGADPNGTCRG